MDNQQQQDNPSLAPENTEPTAQSIPPPASEQLPTSKSAKPKWFIPALLAAVLVLGGGAAAYVTVFQKSPETLWKSALTNTANGLDEYLDVATAKADAGTEIKGTFKATSPTAADGSLDAKWKSGKGLVSLDVGAAGTRLNAELRAITVAEAKTPDIYLNVDGLDALAGVLGPLAGEDIASQLATANGSWYVIDHTLLDQYAANVNSGGTETSLNLEDIQNISDKMMVVLRDRLFSTEPDKAVFTIAEKIGNEDFEGTASYKMRVSVNKANFKNFVAALKDAAKETKLAEIMKSNDETKTFEEAISYDELLAQIDKANFDDMQADVWIESGGRYVRNVRFYPKSDKKETNYLDFGLNYKGGDVLPLLIKATVDDDGTTGTVSVGIDANKVDSSANTIIVVDIKSNDQSIKLDATMKLSRFSDNIDVTKPDGAKSIYELIGGLMPSDGSSTLLEAGSGDTFQLDDVELQ